MTLEERSDLILAFARVLYVNGQSTDQTLAAAAQLGDTLGLRARILPRWGELQLQAKDTDARLISTVSADPAGVNMDRVASAMQAIEELSVGRLAPGDAMKVINAISQAPPAPTWLFTLAAGAGAAALAVIFGVQHLPAAALVFLSAAAGAVLRRSMAQYSANVFLQPFCAALLAGVIGALAARYELTLPEPGVWTGMVSANALASLRGKRAKIHRGSRRRSIKPHKAHHQHDLHRRRFRHATRRRPSAAVQSRDRAQIGEVRFGDAGAVDLAVAAAKCR
jgi:uncharacterized membrane protein YjjP (DUF1212 family)